MQLGSLFDGIGAFPLSASKHGIKAVWASEIEPFPIKVTSLRFPDMEHLGDITQINGAEIEPVDIITFGSPCTRLSVAGKHDGFDINFECQGNKDSLHEIYSKTIRATDKYQYEYTTTCPVCGQVLFETNESALFFHAIRVIREMRDATDGTYPRFAVWENVPGAFSSNKGEDFRAVLEEIAETEIPMPASGKWAEAGMVRTERVDIAWRVLDAQYWGVPQRRKRIFLVADFGGRCAGEILFKSESLRGDFAESRKTGEEIARDVGDGSTIAMRMREGCAGGGKDPLISEDKSLTLGCSNDQTVFTKGIIPFNTTQITSPYNGNNPKPNDPCHCLAATDHPPAIAIPHIIGFDNQTGQSEGIEVSPSIRSESHGSLPCVASGIIPFNTGQITSPQNGNNPKPGDPCHTLCANEHIPAIAIPQRQINCTPDGITGAVSSKWAKGTGGPAGDECYNLVVEPQLYDMTHAEEVMRPVEKGIAPTLNSRMGTGGNQVPVMLAFTQNQRDEVRDLGDKSGALAAEPGVHQQTYVIQHSIIGRKDEAGVQGPGFRDDGKAFTLDSRGASHAVAYGIDQQGGKGQANYGVGVMPPLCSDSHGTPHAVAYTPSSYGAYEEGCGTLRANGGDLGGGSESLVASYAVRRLTPLECERLMGLPDGWTDIPGASDTARYKALGNSIAVPCLDYIFENMSELLKEGTK
jgi:DNA (cytosine-5)-methyltransferase 1